MNLMQHLSRTLNSSRTLILFASFAGYFFLRTMFLPLSHDDFAYAFIWDGEYGGNLEGMQIGSPEVEYRERVSSLSDIFDSLASYWFTWSGKIFACGLAQLFIWLGKPSFNIANTIVFILLVTVIINLANTWLKMSRAALMWIFFSLFILAASFVTSMLWLTGACNYLWMAFFQLLFLTPYVKALRSHDSSSSPLKIALMSFLGLLAGCSNEAGALATICLTAFMIQRSKAQGIFRTWMMTGFAATIVGCAFMLLAPGNFARLEVLYPNFSYTTEIFFTNLDGFFRVVVADLIALIPVVVYFLKRSFGRLTESEVLMPAFSVAGLLVPTFMLLAPEFNLQISVTSLAFILVAASSAILEMERLHFSLPKKILRPVFVAFTAVLVVYFATFIYTDISIFNAARRQARYIQRNVKVDPVPLSPMQVRHRFEEIHGDKSATAYLEYFGGVRKNENFYLNLLVARYYGARHVLAVEE
ncbi:MAG: hypothetical protein IKE46_07110 [Selenomonadaceae bacterium]|nr:hypothetical protein [Selenomonadaceae bacterium]